MRILEERPADRYLLAIARDERDDDRGRVMTWARSDSAVRLSDGREVGKWVGFHDPNFNAGIWSVARSCDGTSCADHEAGPDEVYVGVQLDDDALLDPAKQAELVVRDDGLHLLGADALPGAPATKAAGAQPTIGIGDALLRGGAVWS